MLIEALNPTTNYKFECTEEEFQILNEILPELKKINNFVDNKDLSLLLRMILRARNAVTKAILESFIETR